MGIKLKICVYDLCFENRYEAFDKVEIQLNNGKSIMGTIEPIQSTEYFYVRSGDEIHKVVPDEVYNIKKAAF